MSHSELNRVPTPQRIKMVWSAVSDAEHLSLSSYL